jgi:hypothetical protein
MSGVGPIPPQNIRRKVYARKKRMDGINPLAIALICSSDKRGITSLGTDCSFAIIRYKGLFSAFRLSPTGE